MGHEKNNCNLKFSIRKTNRKNLRGTRIKGKNILALAFGGRRILKPEHCRPKDEEIGQNNKTQVIREKKRGV